LRYSAQARQAGSNKEPARVRVGLANEQGFPHSGVVDFLDNQIDATTGTIHARAVLSNSDRLFMPGMYVRVQLAAAKSEKAFLIDDEAVLTDQDRKYVYVLGPGDKAVRKEVKLGPLNDGLRVIESGLSEHDSVVVGGIQRIFYPGAPLKPTVIPMDAASHVNVSEATAGAAQ
jgi:multidrug efflux system membrane fusion protein